MRFMRPRAATRFPCLAALLLALGGGTGMSAMADSASPAPARPVVLRFLNAPRDGEPLLHPPKLGIAIGGPARPAVLDTGSTGIVISASSIPNLAALPDLGEGRLTYSSSGRIMIGRYVRTPVTLSGANGGALTTRPLPVLAVTRIACLRTARNCQPNDAPRGVAMLGVGFAREKDGQAGGTPDKNPFLNLPGMADPTQHAPGTRGALGRGYILSRAQVQVGLGERDGDAFARMALAASPIAGEWQPPAACFALNHRAPACGSLLVDTGVTRSFLTVPEAQFSGLLAPDGRLVLADGVRVDILPAPGKDEPRYSFVVGDRADPLAPDEVVLVPRPGRSAFLNTSVRLLNGFDYLFDADGGAVGLRRIPR